MIEESQDDGSPRYADGDQLGLSGLQRAFQEQLAGTAGFTVSVVSTDENTGDEGREIASVAPEPGTPVQTPLVPAVQNAADAAVAGQTLPTHLVVVRPGTGEILAVSSNAAADAGNALAGHFPPGSSMKTMTATALLSAGTAHARTPRSPCPGTTVVEGREFENAGPVRPGHRAAHARRSPSPATRPSSSRRSSCPTARSPTAAASYGVGTDWELPVDIFSGAVPGRQHRARRRRPTRSARARC